MYIAISYLFVAAPQKLAIACLDFKWSKSKFQGTFNELLYNKNIIEMKQEVWWVQSLIEV